VWQAHAPHSAVQARRLFWQHRTVPRVPTIVLGLSLLSATALAGPTTAPVIGGHNAPAGAWPDIAGIVFDYGGGQTSVDCSGTLIAPTLVITAGHCNDASLVKVMIGTTSRSQLGDGELIDVAERFEYPDSWNSFDVTILRLAQPSTKTPRPIATGWARFDITNGAEVALVGFGAVDEQGYQTVDALQEAMSTITDANCTASAGCNAGAMPDGELGAGGGGIDTCPGDSGGPLYLVTDYGTFLAGVTSRGYDSNTMPCSEGGIYERPDAITDWIESTTGVELPKGPGPTADVLVAPGGDGAVQIAANDPRPGTSHTYQILAQAQHGVATVGTDGVVRYDGETGYLGPDRVVVQVADAADPDRAVALEVEVDVVEDTGGGCGCRSGGGSAGALAPLLLAAFALLRPRRRLARARR
jgi:endonuclease G